MLCCWSCQCPFSAVGSHIYSCPYFVRDFVRNSASLVKANRLLSECPQIVPVFLWKASCAIAVVLSESAISRQSLNVWSLWFLLRLLKVSHSACLNLESPVLVHTYGCQTLLLVSWSFHQDFVWTQGWYPDSIYLYHHLPFQLGS